MIHHDRPSIRLTADERRQFDELAASLRYELDGATFDPPRRRRVGRRHGPGGRRRRAVRRVRAAAGTWWAGPVALALGLLALGPMVVGWVAVAPPALTVLPAAAAGLGGALTTLDLAKRGWRRTRRPPTRPTRPPAPGRRAGRRQRSR